MKGFKYMKNVEIPKLLFKYKSLNDQNDLARLLVMLMEKQIYLPTYGQLNDPLEGASTYISLSIAGQGISHSADEDHPVLKDRKSEYKIISFSSKCDSPQLWAHYGGNYTGVCLCFSSTGVLNNVKKVIYTNCKPLIKRGIDSEELGNILLKNFLHKEKHWSYEQEWRYIERTRNRFLSYKNEDLKCILLGNRIEPEIKKLICQAVDNTPVLKTHIGIDSYKIRFLPMDYLHRYDGSSPPFIDNLEEYLY